MSDTENRPAPRIRRILETSLYVQDPAASARFYEEVLGLEVMTRTERLIAMHAGEGTVLLLFERGATASGGELPGGWIPPHHGEGPAHFALAIARGDLEAWRARLAAAGVEVESEVEWHRGGVSLYFRDADGYSVELATEGLWPVY
ncbi:MAG TPA: VOC family protein [Longimicrobiales bacterium]|nr:VOC family protein [Longimicrobiales bacterium]